MKILFLSFVISDFVRALYVFRALEHEDEIIVAGDGQMDSPGHCAKHCVYSIMDRKNFYILHLENIDVRSTQLKSTVMETKGCEDCLLYLLQRIKITEFVSDANTSVARLLSKFANIIFINDISPIMFISSYLIM